VKRPGNRLARARELASPRATKKPEPAPEELSFTKSDEEAGTRGPCQSAMHTAL
jgi:hypothetical protein